MCLLGYYSATTGSELFVYWKGLLDIRLEAYSEIPSRFWQTYSIYLSIIRVWSRFDRIRKNFGRTLALGLGTAYLM